VNTPILSSVPDVQVSNVPVTATGTKAKHVISLSPQVPSSSMPSSSPPVPIPSPLPPPSKDPIQTRSHTGNSKPNANFMKNVFKKGTDKQNGGKNSRSSSK